MSGMYALTVAGSARGTAISATASVVPERIRERASRDLAGTSALPPYFQSLIRQNQESGSATPDWEDRIRERLVALEVLLDYGIR